MATGFVISENGLNKLSCIYAEAGANFSMRKDFSLMVPAPVSKSAVPFFGTLITLFRRVFGYLIAPRIPVTVIADFNPPPEFDFAPGGRTGVIGAKISIQAKVQIGNSAAWNVMKATTEMEISPRVVFNEIVFKQPKIGKINVNLVNHNFSANQTRFIQRSLNAALSLAQIYLDDLLKFTAYQTFDFTILNKQIAFTTGVSGLDVSSDRITVAMYVK